MSILYMIPATIFMMLALGGAMMVEEKRNELKTLRQYHLLKPDHEKRIIEDTAIYGWLMVIFATLALFLASLV